MRRVQAAFVLVLVGLVFSPAAASSQEETAPPDPWEPLRLLPGVWQGEIDGRLGTGSGIREYRFILDGQFLEQRHGSVRLPQEKSPAGDHHRELSVFSYDRDRETIVLRSFIVEGYVNTYTCDTEPMRFVCTAEHTENGLGFQVRWTIEIESPYEFNEIFELASPDEEELSVYFTNRWVRQPEMPWSR